MNRRDPSQPPRTSEPTVYYVDDDAPVREALGLLLEANGLRAEGFDSAESFLLGLPPDPQGCLVLDLRLPGLQGSDVQAELGRRGIDLPIIFLTGHGDVPTSVQAMRAGAADFLLKPVNGQVLLWRLREAMARNQAARQSRLAREALRSALRALTPREREVLALAISGLPSKTIARRLALSHRTVESHRSRILIKLGRSHVHDVMQAGDALGLTASDLVAWLAVDVAGARPGQSRPGKD